MAKFSHEPTLSGVWQSMQFNARAAANIPIVSMGEWMTRMGTNHINSVMHVADMPHWKAVKNMTLFAEEVIPRLRKSGGVQ